MIVSKTKKVYFAIIRLNMFDNGHPSIYTIIVTYNGERWIRNCLAQLSKSGLPVHTIVIDNASQDGTVDIIHNEFSDVELLKNTENKGFGAANNIAIQIALQQNADYVFLLNQDAYIEKDTLSQMVKLFKTDTVYGIISPVQLNGDGTALDANFKKYLARVLSNDLVKIEQKRYIDTSIVPVRFVNAAAWLIPYAVIKKVGLFHPLFFHYGEDNNYSSRVQYHGYKVGIALNAYVLHDRTLNTNKQKELLRKIKTIIRYTATDPRKSFAAAYLQGWYKYFGLWNKARNDLPFYRDALEKEKSFLLNMQELKSIRKQMKQPL